jgi:hypothetical protein
MFRHLGYRQVFAKGTYGRTIYNGVRAHTALYSYIVQP